MRPVVYWERIGPIGRELVREAQPGILEFHYDEKTGRLVSCPPVIPQGDWEQMATSEVQGEMTVQKLRMQTKDPRGTIVWYQNKRWLVTKASPGCQGVQVVRLTNPVLLGKEEELPRYLFASEVILIGNGKFYSSEIQRYWETLRDHYSLRVQETASAVPHQ